MHQKPKKFPTFTEQIPNMNIKIQAISHKRKECCSIFYLLLIAYCLMPNTSFSQDTIKRPKIGLVLSGGGAKGFAHIGVLKIIEQAGVKIDYIGGTSMGSVIGGLYASGYTATQIDSLFQKVNFDELLSDYIPRNSKSFYEKRNDEMYALSLPFHKMNIGIPLSYSKGMYNYNLLNKLFHPVHHTRDFSKLPIPFVCVATNIETGEEVVLKNGYLPEAILASSAFPTLFSPVEINEKLLIDGGVVNNYPIEEVKKMGADIIIGVDVQDDLKDREALKDATRILVQISNLQMLEAMKNKIQKTDIYIKPDIKNYTVISFNEGAAIIKKGEEATTPFFEQLQKLSTNYKKPPLKTEVDSIQVDKIEVNYMKNYTRAYVIGKLGFKTGAKISYNDLTKSINKLNATQNFKSIHYELNDFNNNDELNLTLTENKIKTFLKFGLHYDGLYKSAILSNITQKRMLFKNDVLSFDLILGDNFRYNLDYYIDNGFYFSFGFKSRYNQFNKNITTDFNNGLTLSQLNINSINIDFSDLTNQAYVQTIFAQKFLIGMGTEYKNLKISTKTLQNTDALFEKSSYGSVFGYIKYDSFDNKYFPKKGWYFNGDFQTFLFSSNYSNQFNRFSIIKGDAAITYTFLKKINLKLQTDAGFSFGEKSVPYFNFVLGGYGYNTINNFKHFYGYDFISLAANSFIKSSATLDYQLFKKHHLNFTMNVANLEDNLFESGNWFSIPQYTGYAVGYGMETIIGPIEVKYSWSPELPKGYTWFSVGFWF